MLDFAVAGGALTLGHESIIDEVLQTSSSLASPFGRRRLNLIKSVSSPLWLVALHLGTALHHVLKRA